MTCPICGGVGFICLKVPVGDPRFGKAVPCQCMAEKRREKYLQQLKASLGLGTGEHYSFDDFHPEWAVPLKGAPAIRIGNKTVSAQEELQTFKDICVGYAEQPEGWLILQGTFGSGKTMLAACIVERRYELGHPAILVTVPDLLDSLRGGYDDDTFETRLEEMKNVALLVMDDFGTENATDWATEKLFQIINHRYRNRLPLVVTTNEDLRTTREIDGRIISRLLEGTQANGWCKYLVLRVGDYRPVKEMA